MILFCRNYGTQPQTLIVLHGLFGQSDNWTSLARRWSEMFAVITPDQRNHGQSPHSDEFNYDLMADDLKNTADALGLESFSLLGHSMGGKTAMLFAQKYPQYLKKLIVADIAPRYYAPHHAEIIAALKSLNIKNIKDRQTADIELAKTIKEPSTRQFLLKNLYRKEDNTFDWRFNLTAIANNIHEVGAALPQSPVYIDTLFLRGERSNYIQNNDEALIKLNFPNSEIQTIPHAGHWLHAEQPLTFSDAVLRFLAVG